MNPDRELKKFVIEFKEKQYECIQMEKNGRTLYQIKFADSYIYLTESITRKGERFWTSIPQDYKLSHIIPELGKQIENKKL
jgi:hypothetical protein